MNEFWFWIMKPVGEFLGSILLMVGVVLACIMIVGLLVFLDYAKKGYTRIFKKEKEVNDRTMVSAWPFPTAAKDVKTNCSTNLISIAEAAAKGIQYLRKPVWAMPEDHIKIDIIEGKPGIWIHLYSPFNKECNARDPVDRLISLQGEDAVNYKSFVPYTGPLVDSDEYQAKVKQFEGGLSKEKK